MTVANGLDGQIGFAEESTYGTPVTPTRFIEFNRETFDKQIERIESQGLRAGGNRVVNTTQVADGRINVTGGFDCELQDKGMGLLWKHAFGAVSTSQPGGATLTYDHTLTPGELGGDILTAEIGWDDLAGSSYSKEVQGLKISGWTLGARVGELVTCHFDGIGEDLTADAAHETASYVTGMRVLSFVGATLTLDASGYDVEEIQIAGENNLDDQRYNLGSQLRKEPIEQDRRVYRATVNGDWLDWTAYNRFLNGTRAALVALFRGTLIEGALYHQLEVTMNVRTDGQTPQVDGRARIKQPLTMIAEDDGSGPGSAITAVYRTTDATP